jgi:hypothetical protein
MSDGASPLNEPQSYAGKTSLNYDFTWLGTDIKVFF